MPTTEHLEVFICRSRGSSDISLQDALDLILTIEDVKTKEDLDILCGGKMRNILYSRVERISKTHWNKINEPEASIRAHYEKKLKGYKIYNGTQPYGDSYDKGYSSGYKGLEFIISNCDPEGYEEGYGEGRQEALKDNPHVIEENDNPPVIKEITNTRVNLEGSNCVVGDIVTFRSSNSKKFCRITGVKGKSVSVIDIEVFRCDGFITFKDLPIDCKHNGHLNFSRNLLIIGKCNLMSV